MPPYQAPPDVLAGTPAEMFPRPPEEAGFPVEAFIDVSTLSPPQQQQALADLIAADDAAYPAPFTGTPPWLEGTDPWQIVPGAVMSEEFTPAPDLIADQGAEDALHSTVTDAPTSDIPEWTWYNDDQYHGLGVPPGVPNWNQPVEYGRTQIVLPRPSDEHGWDEWSGRPGIARVARHENNFPAYNASQSRGHGVAPIKFVMPYVLLTQQYRDMLLTELKARGVHNAVIADVPSVPYTETVQVTDPSLLAPEAPIGPEGVSPW